MWIVQFLPDWIFNAMALLGVLGVVATYLLKFVPIPFLYMYRTPIQLVSVALIAIGTFMSGAAYNNSIWVAEADKLKEKIAQAEEKAKQQNTKVVEKIVYKTKVIKEKGDTIIQYVDREIVKHDAKFGKGGICEIPKEFIKAHNDASEGVEKK